MRRLSTLSLMGLVMLSACDRADRPTYRFHKAVDRGVAVGEGILAVALDSDVYAASREGFPDLRIKDEAGGEVPFVMESRTRRLTEQVREPCPSELVSLRETPDHGLEIVLKLNEKAPDADGMTVVSPLRDYEHRFRVQGAKGEEGWKPLVESGVIFDYSRYMDVRHNDIALPSNNARRFRLEVRQGLDQIESPLMGLIKESGEGKQARQVETREFLRRPFRIDGIDLWRLVERESELRPEKLPYRVEILGTELDSKAQVTRVELESRREPLTAFVLRTSSRNFSRMARVEVPVKDAIGESWREVGRDTIHRFQLAGFLDEKLVVEFPEQRSDRYRLVIVNGDSPPLEVSSVDARGLVYQLKFVAEEDRDYRLEYGSDAAVPPRYDAAAVLASLVPSHPSLPARLGPEAVDHPAASSPTFPEWLNSRAVLMLALALMVVVLAWALFRAGKQISKLTGPGA